MRGERKFSTRQFVVNFNIICGSPRVFLLTPETGDLLKEILMGKFWLPALKPEREPPVVLCVFFVFYLSLGTVWGWARTKNTNIGSGLGSCPPSNHAKRQIDDRSLQKIAFGESSVEMSFNFFFPIVNGLRRPKIKFST